MVEEPYLTEDELQKLLADYPALLSGDQSQVERRWLLVRREVALPSEANGAGRWALDHLFLDSEGVPTLVEVKRSTDTRIRREVIGQLLDYAANAVTVWPPDALRENLQERCERDGEHEEDAIRELLGREDPDIDEFWSTVATNLKAGRVRLIFVADSIPSELKRVIEFLSEQMNPAEVIGIEVKQFAGGTFRTLAARTIGVTEQAREQRRVRTTHRSQREWDEESFFADLATRADATAVDVAKRLLTWMRSRGWHIGWVGGPLDGRMRVAIRVGQRRVGHHGLLKAWSPFYVWSYGKVELQFKLLKARPPFDSADLRYQFLAQLSEIEGCDFADDAIDMRPAIPLALLRAKPAFQAFTSAIDWFASVVEAEATSGRPTVAATVERPVSGQRS